MNCDICDNSTDSTTSLTHHKKIHYTPEKKHFTFPNVAKSSEKNISFISTLSGPSKNRVRAFQCFNCGIFFQEK